MDNEAGLPPAVRFEIAQLKALPIVELGSVRYTEDDEAGSVVIAFELTLPVFAAPAADIRAVEPIRLIWKTAEEIGIRAPELRSGRVDFPRRLPHLNSVRSDEPVSFCVSMAGPDPVYRRFGIAGLVLRLENWLIDAAATGMADTNWHPEVMQEERNPKAPLAFLDLGFFLSRADKLAQGAAVAGMATGHNARRVLKLTAKTVDLHRAEGSEKSLLAGACNVNSFMTDPDKNTDWIGPWILVRIPGVVAETVFEPMTNLEDLYRVLSRFGGDSALKNALVDVQHGGTYGRSRTHRDKSAVLIVAIQRPSSVSHIETALPDGHPALRFDLGVYQLIAGTQTQLEDKDNSLARAFAWPVPRSQMFQRVTGLDRPIPPTLMLGCGALGSAVVQHLLRAGVNRLTLCDRDLIRPHNLARLTATFENVLDMKVDWLEKVADALQPGAHLLDDTEIGRTVSIEKKDDDLVTLDEEEFQALFRASDLIVDATADSRVRERIAGCSVRPPVSRLEIYDRGRIGILSQESATLTPDLFDLYALLVALGAERKASNPLGDWLARESEEGLTEDTITTGLGCASATMRMPGWTAAQHAAAFLPVLTQSGAADTGDHARLGVNALTADGEPLGLTWMDVPSFIAVKTCTEWTLRVTQPVIDRLKALRQTALPVETGGYLFGCWSRTARRVTVVAATPAPPGTVGTPGGLTLTAAEACPKVRALRRRSADRLCLVGTWHSHPGDDHSPSAIDLATSAGAARENRAQGWPTLMTIVSETKAHHHFEAP